MAELVFVGCDLASVGWWFMVHMRHCVMSMGQVRLGFTLV